MAYIVLLLAMSLTLVSGQRPSFAGSRPIGFPEVLKPTTEANLGNRFGEDDEPTTTIRLPVEANGDRDLVDRLSKLPVDQQPFWFINWQAYEAHRQNPQTFPQKPNVFVDPSSNQAQTQQSTSSGQSSSNFNQMMPSNNGNRPQNNLNQPQNNFNQPPNNFNQPPNNFNQPPNNFNRPQNNFNRPPTNSNQMPSNNFSQGSEVNQGSNGLGNRFSDMDLVQTTQKPLTLEELYNAQRIKPVKNADGTTSWQIVDKSVVEALDNIHKKNQTKL